MKISLFSILFGAGSVASGSSFMILDALRIGGGVRMEVSGESVSIENKDWVKVGGSTGEGIFVESKGVYTTGGFISGRYVGSARVGSSSSPNVDGGHSMLASEDQPIMIWQGKNGVAILRLKRYFKNEKGESALEHAKKVNSEMWNKGSSSDLVDEGGSYFCQERIDNWKNYLNGEIGYVKKDGVQGPGILSVIDDNKLTQKVMKTSCQGTEIIYVEKFSFLSKDGKTLEIIDCKTHNVKGKKFNLGKVESVLYGRNKDLKMTDRGIEDGNGNLVKWGSTFLPKITLKVAS
ncbi:hypothetical protein OVS_01035 [Mycoplasma ovis str. Michigan]|uniref:Uncharacterized protein n=1 Tax=Mycoplasma ovis str. Michigan TaxID=1415773 RepID=A0ABN4BMG7_9MOLU|nr:hypothetical protein [Mycoplasma ovis]AHC40171.1 hypothetical protein OVS_01035 [Mycoplasma ovis str. Michigan]